MNTISTYIINLKARVDRKKTVLKEFEGKSEFNVTVVDAIKHEVGAIGLWHTINHIIRDLANEGEEYILICEDDHQFTDHYSKDILFKCINEAEERKADILSGGVSWFDDSIAISQNLFWVNRSSGTQFIIIFRRFFNAILEADFTNSDDSDHKISALSNAKFLICPFLSVQKDYGYSDVTVRNNVHGRVEQLFIDSSEKIEMLSNVSAFFKKREAPCKQDLFDADKLVIPTYIINLPERTERREHIVAQFSGRKEFNTTVVDAVKHPIGAVGLWMSIRKVVEMAIENDDDVIIISEDDHEFTESYSCEALIHHIFEAHEQGMNYISGGSGRVDLAIPFSSNSFWVGHCRSTQFIIVFREFFEAILKEPFDDTVVADILLSNMTSNKMVIHPFISQQRDFGYSDITAVHNVQKGLVQRMFKETSERLDKLRSIYVKYSQACINNQW